MSTLGPLVEYLLAAEMPGGGRLCRFGTVQIVIPFFPPLTTLAFDIYPYFNAHANIQFWYRPSPATLPGAFNWDSFQAGVEFETGVIYETGIAEGHNLWAVVTHAEPGHIVAANLTPLFQFSETIGSFLIVDSPTALQIVQEKINEYSTTHQQVEEQQETNRLLRLLLEREGALLPRQPIARRV